MTNVPRTTQDAQHGTVDDIPLPPPRPLPGPPTGPTVAVSAAAAGQAALVRIARSNMLRAISRQCFAVDKAALPAPFGVRFGLRPMEATLDFESAAEAAEWAVALDATGTATVSATVDPAGGRWCIYTAYGTWRGFAVTLAACFRPRADL